MDLIFSKPAVRDMEAIWEYIARDNPIAAGRMLEGIHASCEMLKSFPDAGMPRPEIHPRIRSVIVGSYIVLYRRLKDAVRIVRVVHGARYLPGIM